MVLEELCNCTRPAPVPKALAKDLYPDGFPCRNEPGIFGNIAGYLGMVEPQMRKTLHIHMLIQLLGFAHPRDLFGHGRFTEIFKRTWRLVASMCFRSIEAFADYTGEPAATAALRQALLSPVLYFKP